MRVFLSWSGERSRRVAEALRDWLPNVIQAIQPWMSSVDVQAGARWGAEVAYALQETRFGIVCITPENVNAPWLLFEAGALSKSPDQPFVCPYLIDFETADLQGPLAQFQAVTASREGTWRLLQTLNRSLGDQGLPEPRLQHLFVTFWPELTRQIHPSATRPVFIVPGDHAVLAEGETERVILENLLRHFAAPQELASAGAGLSKDEYVFIAHGRDRAQRDAVARVIERLGPKVIILDEIPNEGMTIIEKLERYANASYGIVIMTPDDIGGLATIDRELLPRARQNVVLELGYLLARLGRRRLCVLYEPSLELPSDMSGILYITLDNRGAWQFELARELKTAGLRIDVNNLL